MRFGRSTLSAVILAAVSLSQHVQGFTVAPASLNTASRSGVFVDSAEPRSSTRASSSSSSSSSSSDTVSTESTESSSSSSSAPSLPDMAAYAAGYSTVLEEIPCAALSPDEDDGGAVPADLVGTYYRCGPAMFTAGSLLPPKSSIVQPQDPVVADGVDPERTVRHPFEGDGAVLAVSIDGATGAATARYRYVRTAGLTAERKKGRRLYAALDATRDVGGAAGAGLGNDLHGPPPLFRHHLRQGLNKQRKNTSNTRAVHFAKKLLTTWEGGLPYKLDSLALSTEGRSQLGGVLKTDAAPGARAARDAERDRVLFYDNDRERADRSVLTMYEFNAKFNLVSDGDGTGKVETKLPGVAHLSDFCVTRNYGVFLQPPVTADAMRFLLSKDPASTLRVNVDDGASLLHFVARVGSSSRTQTVPIPRDDDLPAEAEVQFVNAFEDDDDGAVVVVVDLIRSDGRRAARAAAPPLSWPWAASLSDWADRSSDKFLWRYRVDLTNGEVVDKRRVGRVQTSYGVCRPSRDGRRHRFVYANVGAAGADPAPPQGVARFDAEDGDVDGGVDAWWPEPHQFCGEPLFAERRGADDDDDDDVDAADGHVLTVLFDGRRRTSSLLVLDAADLASGPVCRLPLGAAVPHGHHGCFVPRSWSFDEIDRRARLADKMEAKGSGWNEVKSDFSGLGLRLDDFEEYFGDIL